MVQGLGNAMIWAPALTLVVLTSSNAKRNQNISLYTTITSVGMTLGPTIGTLSNAILGMRNTFFLATGMALIGVPLSSRLLQKRKSIFSSDYDNPKSNPKFSLNSLREIFSQKTVAVAFAGYVAISYVYSILIAYGTIYAKDSLEINQNLIPLLFVGFNVVVLIARFFLGTLIKHVDKKRIITLSLLNTVLMIILLTLGNQLMFVLGFTLLGISHGLIYPTGAMLVAEATDIKKLNVANAFYMTMWDIGAFTGPTTCSFIVAFGLQTTLAASLIVPLVILGLNLTLWRDKNLNKAPND
jgi:predicted MFS family arabinose efflux permease